ncbi:MAG: phosphodiester glycosidase family protein [Fimbriimonadia bacterium]
MLSHLVVPLSLLLAQSIAKTVAPGVVYTQEIRTSPPMVIHTVRAGIGKDGVSARVALAGEGITTGSVADGRETLSRISARYRAVAAVNGDYFPFTGDPLGLCILNGDLVSEAARNRGAIGWTRDGAWLVGNPTFGGEAVGPTGTKVTISGVNRDCGPGENVLWLPSGGDRAKCTRPGVAVIFRALSQPFDEATPSDAVYVEVKRNVTEATIPPDGAVLFVKDNRGETLLTDIASGGIWKFRIETVDGANWREAQFAIGGGPWLVRNGTKFVDWQAQGFASTHATARHPRTAIGHTAGGDLLLVVVEGRSATNSGMTLDELADLMLSLGAHNALNLDGGGSTQMMVRGLTVSAPSDGAERPTANAIVVLAPEPTASPLALSMEPKVAKAVVGQTLSWQVKNQATGEAVPHSEVVWGCTPGAGWIDQFGTFRANKAGMAIVSAFARGKTLRSVVLIAPKAATSGNSEEGLLVSIGALP